jgi:uncharacterized protein (TIGR04255 family)
MYPNREVFPNAPLALVTAEVRFTDAPRLRQEETLTHIAIALEDRFPLTERLADFNIQQVSGAPPRVEQRVGLVLINDARTESLTITSSSLSYETTTYHEFDDLRTGVAAGCDALLALQVRAGLVRVGLRYIDEIRVPEPVVDVRGWSKWIDGRLVGALSLGPEDAPVGHAQGLVTFDLGSGMKFNLQYAALTEGQAVDPPFLQRRHAVVTREPLFVLDFDGYYEFGRDVAVRLDRQVVEDILTDIHVPSGASFQRAITDDARQLFRGDAE